VPAVTPDINPTAVDLADLEVVDDLDELVASAKCSCSGGDDAPY
jgi:hypothetical protein